VIGLHVAAEQLDQRRLARTVLADERVDLARTHLQRGTIERHLARICLGQIDDVENGRGARIAPGPRVFSQFSGHRTGPVRRSIGTMFFTKLVSPPTAR